MAKIQFKAILHKLGLWLVVKDGPHKCPPSGGGGLIENHNESNNYYYSLRDRVTEGPVTSNQILAIIQKANPSVVIDPHSIYIWHETVTKNEWEKLSETLVNKITVQGSLVHRLSEMRTSYNILPTATPSTSCRTLERGSRVRDAQRVSILDKRHEEHELERQRTL